MACKRTHIHTYNNKYFLKDFCFLLKEWRRAGQSKEKAHCITLKHYIQIFKEVFHVDQKDSLVKPNQTHLGCFSNLTKGDMKRYREYIPYPVFASRKRELEIQSHDAILIDWLKWEDWQWGEWAWMSRSWPLSCVRGASARLGLFWTAVWPYLIHWMYSIPYGPEISFLASYPHKLMHIHAKKHV